MQRLLLVLALLPALAAAPAAQGQSLAFEQVGDRPLDAYDLALGDDTTLWAIDTRVYRLPPGATAWEEINQILALYILPLSPDTLLAAAGHVLRSTDGGQTWAEVHDEGRTLFEAPSSGVLVAGTRVGSGVAYSHDRGATWAAGAIDTGTWSPWAEAFAEIPEGHPPGHPHAGRLVAACWGGLSYSDDGGATWQKSSLWEDSGRYLVTSVTVGVDGRVYAALSEQWVAGTQVAVSDDGGATYEIAYGFGVSRGTRDRIFALPGGADPAVGVVVLVEQDGSVWRSDDAAQSWAQVGQVPFTYANSHLNDAAVGPEGRMYVAGGKAGSEREWVFRTVVPVVAASPVRVGAWPASEPVAVGPGGGAFTFAVTITNESEEVQTVAAWAAVTGPVDRERVAGPVSVTLGPGQTVTREVRQGVPWNAPAGTYTYRVRVGQYPEGAVAEASFLLVKTAGAARTSAEAAGVAEADWAASGWSVSGVERWGTAASSAAAKGPGEALGVEVHPNPARGTATVALTLLQPAEVEAALYDVLGRRVALLHAGRLGAGAHALPLDDASLPPGVYVVRAAAGGEVRTARVTLVR